MDYSNGLEDALRRKSKHELSPKFLLTEQFLY